MRCSLRISQLLLTVLYGFFVSPSACRIFEPQNTLTAISRGSFESPAAVVRPKFRYWLPDASINITTLSSDIAQLGERGAGGIQLLNYFNYGGAQGLPPEEIDWNLYGYATPQYRRVLKAALQATKKSGLIMDYAMGPQSGQGVPAEPDELGLSWELVSFNMSFEGEYHGRVPGWGAGDFVSASTFSILNSTIIPALSRPDANKTEYIFSASSLVDLTSTVSSNGFISLSPQSYGIGNSSLIFTSYARRSYARANVATNENPKDILQNGSFAVDHFSSAGARLTTSFLESRVIPPDSEIRRLFRDVGRYIWEDSVEIPTPTYWSPEILSIFAQQHGYDLRQYIPLLIGFNGDLMLNNPPISIISDDPLHSSIVDDFRDTLKMMYAEYLSTLKNWTNDYLGMQFSAQVAYNLPVDMLSSIPYVDVPETETLAFLNNMDAFRQFSGAANLAGQTVVSIELGADYGQAYSQPLATLIEEASRAYAAGINQIVIHGASYSGHYPRTTYPGFTTFGYLFGAQHSRHQPAWDLGYKETLDWLARAQYILQSGMPKVDLVFWNKQTAQDPFPESLYEETDLINSGYSYTYLSPDNFALPQAFVDGGVLAPNALGAKVLVLRHNDILTPSGVEKLAEFAHSGLCVIIGGGLPDQFSTSNLSAIASAKLTLVSLLNLPNVHLFSLDKSSSAPSNSRLTQLLTRLNIKPRAGVNTNGVWYTRYLTSSDSVLSVFVFSDSVNSTEGTISILTTGVPFLLDLWNGKESPILTYKINEDGVMVVRLKMTAKQALVIQFKDTVVISKGTRPEPRAIHVIDAPSEVLGYSHDLSCDSIIAKIVANATSSSEIQNRITLSNNVTIDISSLVTTVPVVSNMSNWTLTVEKWLPPVILSDIDGVMKRNITTQLRGSELMAWPLIEGITNASGIGTYTNAFAWPPLSFSCNETSLGAYLQIPATIHVQGLAISINGHVLPATDLFNPVHDITSYLTCGSNSVSIRVSTTLWNSLRPVWSQLKTGGAAPQISIETLLANPQTKPLGVELPVGILGTIQVVPFRFLKIS